MTKKPFIIRVSSLPTWKDCKRRWMADLRPAWLKQLGFDLNERETNVGAHCGWGTHIAVAYSWEGFGVQGMKWAHLDDCVQAGFDEFKTRVAEEGCDYDDTTKNENDAQHAIHKMTVAYRQHCKPEWIPEMIERRLEAEVEPGYLLRGHTDLIVTEGNRTYAGSTTFDGAKQILSDLKTGVTLAAPSAQVGGYDILAEMTPDVPDVQASNMVYVRRTRRTTEQPPPWVWNFDREATREEARQTVWSIVDRVKEFRSEGSRNWMAVFEANTASILCGDKYCSAFRTPWCPESYNKPMMKENKLV